MSNLQDFLSVLFDKNETSCFTDKNGVKVAEKPTYGDLFFCINPLLPNLDKEPTKTWHSATRGRRADCNVAAYRNFLLEIDDGGTIQEQIDYINVLLPTTSIVFSGGKSCHFIISLTEPLKSEQEYRNIAASLCAYVKRADPATKNPSRLSRLPFVNRPDTGKKQELLYLGSRIKLETLLELLPVVEESKLKAVVSDQEKKVMATSAIIEGSNNPNNMMVKVGLSGRNQFFFWLGQRLTDINADHATRQHFVDQAYTNLNDKSGFSILEAYDAGRVK